MGWVEFWQEGDDLGFGKGLNCFFQDSYRVPPSFLIGHPTAAAP